MNLGKATQERLKEPENSIETWRQKVKDDPYAVEKLLEGDLPVSEVWYLSARQALDEHKNEQQKQSDALELRRHEREEEVLKLAQEANQIALTANSIAKEAKRWAVWAVVVALVAAFIAAIASW